MKYLIMFAWLYVCMKSIEVKETFKFTILMSCADYWLAIFKVSTADLW